MHCFKDGDNFQNSRLVLGAKNRVNKEPMNKDDCSHLRVKRQMTTITARLRREE